MDLRIVVLLETLGLDRQDVGDETVAVPPERQCVVASATRATPAGGVGIVLFPVATALIDLLEVLERLIEETKEKCGDRPVWMADLSPVFDSDYPQLSPNYPCSVTRCNAAG